MGACRKIAWAEVMGNDGFDGDTSPSLGGGRATHTVESKEPGYEGTPCEEPVCGGAPQEESGHGGVLHEESVRGGTS